MARIDPVARTLAATVVVTGPRQSGKTTLLRTVRRRVPAERRRQDGVEEHATLDPLLDWLPLDLGSIAGWRVSLDLYAVSGTAPFDHTRRLLLGDADGLLLVADSQASRLDDNLAAFRALGEELLDREGATRDLPQVFCWSKQDLPEELVLAPGALNATLNYRGAPAFGADLLAGDGVLESVHALVTLVIRRLAPAREEVA